MAGCNHLISVSSTDPAHHFYHHGFRFDAFAQQLFLPLATPGRVDVWVKHSAPDNSAAMIDYHYQIRDVDVILFEGIFLFQKRFEFDYKIWVDCSFATALDRALQRNQEGLSEAEIRRDYETIYFPAQRLHLALDQPRYTCEYLLRTTIATPSLMRNGVAAMGLVGAGGGN